MPSNVNPSARMQKRYNQLRDFMALCLHEAMQPGMEFSFKVTKPVPATDRRYIARIGPTTRITFKIFPAKKKRSSPRKRS